MGDVSDAYIHERLTDGLKKAADSAYGLGMGQNKMSEAQLHSRFIQGLRQAENAARMMAHSRGAVGGFAWLKLATKLGGMLESSSKAASLSVVNTAIADGRKSEPRGPLWIRLAEGLAVIAADCFRATRQRTDKALILGGMEYLN